MKTESVEQTRQSQVYPRSQTVGEMLFELQKERGVIESRLESALRERDAAIKEVKSQSGQRSGRPGLAFFGLWGRKAEFSTR